MDGSGGIDGKSRGCQGGIGRRRDGGRGPAVDGAGERCGHSDGEIDRVGGVRGVVGRVARVGGGDAGVATRRQPSGSARAVTGSEGGRAQQGCTVGEVDGAGGIDGKPHGGQRGIGRRRDGGRGPAVDGAGERRCCRPGRCGIPHDSYPDCSKHHGNCSRDTNTPMPHLLPLPRRSPYRTTLTTETLDPIGDPITTRQHRSPRTMSGWVLSVRKARLWPRPREVDHSHARDEHPQDSRGRQARQHQRHYAVVPCSTHCCVSPDSRRAW